MTADTCRALLILLVSAPLGAQTTLSRTEWGAPPVAVSRSDRAWVIAGQRVRVTLGEKDLGVAAEDGAAQWVMVPSTGSDMLVKVDGHELSLGLAQAEAITIAPYDTGFKTGVSVTLAGWRGPRKEKVDLTLHLTIALEGRDEDLVFDVTAEERGAVLRQLDWPTALDARGVDFTLLPNGRGNLLPRDWPKEYFPIRTITPEGKIAPTDHSVLQSHVIEAWSMSWWGFQKGEAAMMLIVETPDDAAYQFAHPAGGPTVIGPRWLSTLGRFGYMRSVRLCSFAHGNYVTLAKRYRRHVMETGLFVSLKEKIARTPLLADLIGSPQTRVSILRNMKPEGDRFRAPNAEHYRLTTFDERAQQLRDLKARGVLRTLVLVSGWPHLGYDRQHPDPLPPPEAAGGWAGLKRLADTCRELSYPMILHDQYRDYYVDAPSYDPRFAIHEEDASLPARAFAGSRFGDSKEGQIPFMQHWDGGKQSYLSARFQAGHLRKNCQLLFDHAVRPQGIYIDVIGYVPPDEDFSPEHPTTRGDAMRGQTEMLHWSRHNLGVTVTESGSDWVIPYVDSVNSSGGVGKCVPVPLYNLVYHDAVLVSYGAGRTGSPRGLLMGLLAGGMPELPVTRSEGDEVSLALIRQMGALNKRVALLEMTNHEFLDTQRSRERSTFADGTTVTVDWNDSSVVVDPPLAEVAR